MINEKNIFIIPPSVIPARQQIHLRKVPLSVKLLARIIKGTHDVSSDTSDFVLYNDCTIQESVAIKCGFKNTEYQVFYESYTHTHSIT